MYIYTYTYIYIYMYAYINIHTNIYICICICIYAYIHIYINVHMCPDLREYATKRILTYTYVYIYIYVCIYIPYTCTCIYIYICVYTYIPWAERIFKIAGQERSSEWYVNFTWSSCLYIIYANKKNNHILIHIYNTWSLLERSSELSVKFACWSLSHTHTHTHPNTHAHTHTHADTHTHTSTPIGEWEQTCLYPKTAEWKAYVNV